MKENNGHSARQKLLKQKLVIVLLIFLCVIGGLVSYDKRYKEKQQGMMMIKRRSGGASRRQSSLFADLIRTDDDSRRHRRKPKQWDSPETTTTRSTRTTSSAGWAIPKIINNGQDLKYKDVLSAELHLIDIDIVYSKLGRSPPNDYDEGSVYGIFCKLNWTLHKNDPSSVPMFRFLKAASKQCDRTIVRVPLKEIARLARDMDQQNNIQQQQQQQSTTDDTSSSSSLVVPKPLNFTGIIFHESRCGSTLVANTLIAMNPTKHRVYAESPPPIMAMKCVIDEKCNIDQAAAILRDVLYMMGRTNDPREERVFFKIQSVGSRHIDVFRKAFPTTPFLFVYREPVQVMMSHMANGKRANCLRSYKAPPTMTQQLIQRHGYYSSNQLSPPEFCAAHLASITESALENLQSSPNCGIAVNYNTLPQLMYETILPKKLGVSVGQREIDRIIKVAGMYSKGKGDRKGMMWRDDSERKEESANEDIRKAAKLFMQESYDGLQEFAAV